MQASTPAATTPPPAPKVPIDQLARELDTLAELTKQAKTWFVTQGPAVLLTLVLFVIAYVLAGWTRKVIIRAMSRAHIDLTLAKFLGNVSRWAIIIFAVVACLGTFGVNTTSFAALIGGAGLAIGLALQGNLGNLASGVLLLVFRPFKIGDSVIVAGKSGVVDGIDLFTTALDTADYRRIIVPNGAIFGGVIENQTHHDRRRIDVSVPVSGEIEFETTAKIFQGVLDEVVAHTEGAIHDPGNAVALAEVFPAVVWEFNLWCKTSQVAPVRRTLLMAIKRALDANKLSPAAAALEVKVTGLPAEIHLKP